jgi:hypothetical protein
MNSTPADSRAVRMASIFQPFDRWQRDFQRRCQLLLSPAQQDPRSLYLLACDHVVVARSTCNVRCPPRKAQAAAAAGVMLVARPCSACSFRVRRAALRTSPVSTSATVFASTNRRAVRRPLALDRLVGACLSCGRAFALVPSRREAELALGMRPSDRRERCRRSLKATSAPAAKPQAISAGADASPRERPPKLGWFCSAAMAWLLRR